MATLKFLHPVSFSWLFGLEPLWFLGLCIEVEATLPHDLPAQKMGQALQSQKLILDQAVAVAQSDAFGQSRIARLQWLWPHIHRPSQVITWPVGSIVE